MTLDARASRLRADIRAMEQLNIALHILARPSIERDPDARDAVDRINDALNLLAFGIRDGEDGLS